MLPQTVKLFAIDSRCRPRLKTAPGPPAAPHTVNKDRLFVGEQEVLAKIAVSLWARNPNLNTAAQPLTEFYQGVSTFSQRPVVADQQSYFTVAMLSSECRDNINQARLGINLWLQTVAKHPQLSTAQTG